MSLECPYCEYKNDEPCEGFETEFIYKYQCNSCEKNFGYEVELEAVFLERKLPCENGEPHKYREYINKPSHTFVLAKCIYCEEKTNFERKDWERLKNETQRIN